MRTFVTFFLLACGFLAPLSGFSSWISKCENFSPRYNEFFETKPEISAKISLASSQESQLNVVDILVVFDGSARNWLLIEGKGTIEEYAKACIEKMNACLTNSSIAEFKFRLAGTFAVNEDVGGDSLPYTLYNRLVDMDGNFVGTGEWKNIFSMRDKVGADIVSVLVAHGNTGIVGCGYSLNYEYRKSVSKIPNFARFAYNVCSIQSADECCMQMHEVAHNMGCGHANSSCAKAGAGLQLGPQLFDYSSGYYFWVDGIGYHTILGYNFGGLLPDGSYDPHQRFIEIPCFSSPDLNYLGVPCGTLYNDNRRTLRETYRYVAQFKVSRHSAEDESDVPIIEPNIMPYMSAASIYDGYLLDEAETPVGTIRVKVAKGKLIKSANIYASSVTAKVQLKESRESVSFRGGKAFVDGSVTEMWSNGYELSLSIGRDSISGFIGENRIIGVRNFFSGKNDEDRKLAKRINSIFKGKTYNIAFPTGFLGLKFVNDGKVKVSGRIGDRKVSSSAQLLIAEDVGLVSVFLQKPAKISFNINIPIDDLENASVDGLGTEWEIGMPLALHDDAVFDIGDGVSVLQKATSSTGIVLAEFLPGAIDALSIKQKGYKWIVADNAKIGTIAFERGSKTEIDIVKAGKNPSALKLTYMKNSGAFRGSFKFYCITSTQKIKIFPVDVSGVLVGGKGLGLATCKKLKVFWPIVID